MNRALKTIAVSATLLAMFANGVYGQTIAESDKSLPLSGSAFTFNGHDAFIIVPGIIVPGEIKPGMPWVWYAPTLPGLPGKEETWMFQKFLDAGIAVVGIDVGESYGSPTGQKIYSEFYDYLVSKKEFGKRPVLLARSRGGLMLYSWAIKNPKSVAGIAGIYPVCNIASYPGIERACGAYSLSAEQLKAQIEKYNPIDLLEPLAKANVPIFHIHGDQDEVVPLEKNSQILAERYKELNGKITLQVVEGQGHNMWNGWFHSENLVDFVLENAQQKSK